MARFLKVLVLALCLSGCTHYQPRIYEAPKPQAVVVTHTMLRSLIGASAKFTAYKRESLFLPEKGIILEADIPQWTGSAFCISFSKHSSVWLTCAHVADMAELGDKASAAIDYIGPGGLIGVGNVMNIRVSKTHDIAIFESRAIPAYQLDLALGEEAKLNIGDFLMGVGHPAGGFPASVTFGAFIGYSDDEIRFTTWGYYGSSGSAIIDAKTMTVVGILHKYGGSKYRHGFRSDDLRATRANIIRKFIAVPVTK